MLGPGPVRFTQTVTGQSTILATDATGPGTSGAQLSAKTNRSTVTSAAPPTERETIPAVAAWKILERNPTHEMITDAISRCPKLAPSLRPSWNFERNGIRPEPN